MNDEEKDKLRRSLPVNVKINASEESRKILISKINKWVVNRGWKQIEGGEFDKKWVNNSYPDTLFDTGILRSNDSLTYFPIVGMNKDDLGLCCAMEISCAGSVLSIFPNKWRSLESTRKGRRREKTALYRKKRLKKKEAILRDEKKAASKKSTKS